MTTGRDQDAAQLRQRIATLAAMRDRPYSVEEARALDAAIADLRRQLDTLNHRQRAAGALSDQEGTMAP